MTATQFVEQFITGIYDLAEAGVVPEATLVEVYSNVLPLLRSALEPALTDEREYYEEGPVMDIEYDFHALDDAKFERIESGYEEVWSSQ